MKLHKYLLALAATAASLTSLAEKPNLIVIMTDDMGYNDVGFNGGTEIPTPHIDTIADQGVRFTNGYVSYPVCGPSRAGFITGRYQQRFGFERNPNQVGYVSYNTLSMSYPAGIALKLAVSLKKI